MKDNYVGEKNGQSGTNIKKGNNVRGN